MVMLSPVDKNKPSWSISMPPVRKSTSASPSRTTPPRPALKRKASSLSNRGEGQKRFRSAKGRINVNRRLTLGAFRRPTKPVGEAWPLHELHAFDAPTNINYGPMLRDVLRCRGWKYSKNPCHGTEDEETGNSTFFVKEFEASVLGQSPAKVFGKNAVVQDGYRLQTLPLPKHALWMMTRLPFRVPGTDAERTREREDFVKIVVQHGDKLSGKPGNYRIARFPGTEKLLWKTCLTEAFQDKAWYPTTFTLPRDKAAYLKEIRSRGNSKNNLWIGKPRNDYGGCGIRVYKGTDPDLLEAVEECDKHPSSIMQHYLADPHLVGGYKYHMRIHLFITSLNPLQAFVQENGQCLFATKPYTLASNTMGKNFDPPAHVTNMGLNSKPENKENYFSKKPIVGRGQQIRMQQLVSHLADTRPDFRKRALWQQILSIAADTTRYIAQGVPKASKLVSERHFELFGMDLMLDKNLKVWMCEVNTDPGLSYPPKEVLGSPNPDYHKELRACEDTFHDMFAVLGVDAGREQARGSLRHWFELDFSDTDCQTRSRTPPKSA